MWNTNSPPGVEVSIASVRDRNWIPPIRQIAHEFDQVSDRASEAVNTPDQQRVTWVEVFQTRSEGRAAPRGSGRMINEDPGGTGNC